MKKGGGIPYRQYKPHGRGAPNPERFNPAGPRSGSRVDPQTLDPCKPQSRPDAQMQDPAGTESVDAWSASKPNPQKNWISGQTWIWKRCTPITHWSHFQFLPVKHRHNYRVGQKNRTCLSVDNSAMVSGRKSCDTSKVSECCRKINDKFA